MPLNVGKDSEGCFVRYGNEGKKYHYTCGNKEEADRAKQHAINQAIAIGEADQLTKKDKHWVDNYIDMIEFLKSRYGNKK